MPRTTHRTGKTMESPAHGAERWGVSIDTVYRLVREGKISAYRLNRRIMRIDPDELDACFNPVPAAKAVGA